jgi:AraC-like DNA-binding protein
MKPSLRKAVPNPECSFIVRMDVGKNMKNNWHYHPDCELLYIRRSTGTWLVGDYVGRFRSGDVILIGPNLPHSFRHEYAYVMERDKEPGEAIVALFLKRILGDTLLDLPEVKGIKNILALSEKGLKLTGRTRQKVAAMMEKMLDESPGRKLIDLLLILQMIAEEKGFKVLASNGFSYDSDGVDNARINAIFEYTFNNYQNQITVEEIAALVNMGKHSFCRYFKEKTKKTYIQFLMEVRIGKACRLLLEDDMNVAEVCYSSGFNSISHFNHQFKAIKNKSPMEYKQSYLNLLIRG